MDQVTQQNAAMVEEATAAATSLKGEAAELARLVGTFETGDGEGARPRPVLVQSGRHAPVANPVRRAQTKLASTVHGSGASRDSWEEF
jgi:methyl-accepting chemotaxis protein